jgi:hypothetical protein
MHTSNKKTKGADLSSILEGLIRADVKFILVGGLAAVVQGLRSRLKNLQRP